MTRVRSPFDIKSASITGLALVLRTADMASITAELASRVHDAGDLFSNAPVLIDVTVLTADGSAHSLALAQLVDLLAGHTMRAVGIVGASGELLAQALALGLLEELAVRPRSQRKLVPDAAPARGVVCATPDPAGLAEGDGAAGVQASLRDGDRDAGAESGTAMTAEMQATVQTAIDNAVAGLTAPTMVLDKPLRSGQRVYARGGDLVVLGVVSHGAEVIADGNIHVYGPLRGRAIAGANGDTGARIFAAAMEPELISIAGTYRTTDTPLAAAVQGKPAQARLDGEKLLIEPLKN